MVMPQLRGSKRIIPLALAAGLVGTLAVASQMKASDHQQTPLTELNPRLDITDVFVFPGSTDQRIVLAMTVASPLIGMNTLGRFDPNALYQIKVDNNQSGMEDVVLQFSFDELANGTQTVDVMGPSAPRPADNRFNAPFSTGGVRDFFLTGTPAISRGALNTTLTAGSGADALQVWVGVRDDPFYIDLAQFFRIIPDRRPTEGPLSLIGGVITNDDVPAGSFVPESFTGRSNRFRARCETDANGNPISGRFLPNQDQFDQTRGCAVDFLRGVNALAIIVELPESRLLRAGQTGADAQIGVWATVSR
ncbi:hypothetical protein BH23GEM5_BH23GEM5_12520 [soil metagenome]